MVRAPRRGGSFVVGSDGNQEAGSYHFLDMGKKQYGDCILAQFLERSVLVDGGHPEDLQGQANFESIPEQLERIFGHEPPFDITLLVVTHAHNDHIGCLPELVQNNIIRPRFALITAVDHGFPAGSRDDISDLPAADAADTEVLRQVLAGLAEEDLSDLPEAELRAVLDRAPRMAERYRRMIATLERRGVPVVQWGVTPAEQLLPIYEALEGTGFDVIGPSQTQLEACRDQIVRYSKRNRDLLVDALASAPTSDSLDTGMLAAALYRGRAGTDRDATDMGLDRVGEGSALNCQSIMLKFGHDDRKVLLTGDMQFADPEVRGIGDEMADLLRQAQDAGPYWCLKLPHHMSYNGVDRDVWRALGSPPILVHSGGLDDPSHPEPKTLAEFEEIDDDVVLARTDRNGLITVSPNSDPRKAVAISRGELDDYRRNPPRRRDQIPAGGPPETVRAATAPASRSSEPPEQPSPSADDDHIEILFVRLPYREGRVRIDGHEIEVAPGPPRSSGGLTSRHSRGGLATDDRQALAGGRPLPNLLFVTEPQALARNIGADGARDAMALIRRDARLLEVAPGQFGVDQVRDQLERGDVEGVVLVGGYDVLAPERVDVLGPLRPRISDKAKALDIDQFYIWSDDHWADPDGDRLAELPVTRVPDARSAAFLMRALRARGEAQTGAFGMRNAERPYAEDVFARLGGRPSLVSAPGHFSDYQADALARRHVYFMLHGDHRDPGRFWGDDAENETLIEAVNVEALPADGLDIVFSGCCWGALTVRDRADTPSTALAPHAPEESIALSCLQAGARAYVGCTGVHYSPDESGSFFGGPMHHAFWREILEAGKPPAEALFAAKQAFLADMPHGRRTPLEIGIEQKIYSQFTCLGLGW